MRDLATYYSGFWAAVHRGGPCATVDRRRRLPARRRQPATRSRGMRTGPNCGSDRQRVVRRAGCSCALSATDRRADRRRDALAPGKECLQPVEHESGLLFDDPVSGVVNCLDLEVTHAIGIAAQQRRGDHWVSGSTSSATQLQKGPLNCCFTVEAIGTYSNLASLRETYSDLRKRIHGSPMRPRLLRNQGPPPPFEALPDRLRCRRDRAEIRVRKHDAGDRRALRHLQDPASPPYSASRA